MKHIDYNYDGRPLALSLTMEALLCAMERYGSDADILATILAPTPDGWRECCWMAALMAAQGELQRRALGYDPQPMITMEELRSGVMAADGNGLRMAVKEAFVQGMTRTVDPDRDAEINLVIAEREREQKKKNLEASARAFLRSALSACISPRETS